MSEANKQLARRWFEEVWNQGREAAIDELLAPGAVGFGLAGPGAEIHAAGQLKSFVRNLRDAFPDVHITIEDMVAEADKVAVRFRVTGTHTGGGLGIAGTGRTADFTGMTIIQFKDGKLFHGWNNWDQLGMLQQLGVAPGPVRVNQLLDKRA
jgi:steroid delta-isomerase-like uncharacterized protein